MVTLDFADEVRRRTRRDGKAAVAGCGGDDPVGHRPAVFEGRRISSARDAPGPATNAARVNVLVIHGPNLNLLGTREPEIYGSQTLADVDRLIASEAATLGLSVRCVQHNSEGAIVDELHAARGTYDAIVLNAGAYTHYGYATRDAIAAAGIPTIEVHLTNTLAREAFRATSVIGPVCRGTIAGFGADSYLLALRALSTRS
jgi:3-dehydroquinate dehydratase-2